MGNVYVYFILKFRYFLVGKIFIFIIILIVYFYSMYFTFSLVEPTMRLFLIHNIFKKYRNSQISVLKHNEFKKVEEEDNIQLYKYCRLSI
jgi:hypothetical protein